MSYESQAPQCFVMIFPCEKGYDELRNGALNNNAALDKTDEEYTHTARPTTCTA